MSDPVYRPIIGTTGSCFTFPIRCCVSKPEHLERECGQKSKPNFALFDPGKI